MNPNRTRLVFREAGVKEYRYTLIPYGDTWKAVHGAHGHDTGFEVPAFDDSLWASEPGAWGLVGDGVQTGGPLAPPCVQNRALINTAWVAGTDITLRQTITIPVGTTRLYVEYGADNEAYFYLDGTLVESSSNSGCQTRGSNSFWVNDPPTGAVVLAVRAVDTGSPGVGQETFFDARVVAYHPDNLGSPDELLPIRTGRQPGRVVAEIEDMKKVGVSEDYNAGGEVYFTLPNSHPYIGALLPWETHWAFEQYSSRGWTEENAGWLIDLDATDEETVFYGRDYLGVMSDEYDERFNPDQAPDAAAEIYPADAAGAGGAKYTDERLDTIIGDQIDRAINQPNGNLSFFTRGAIASMPETVTIFAQLTERLSFIAGLIDSHRAGTGKRTRLIYRKIRTYTTPWAYTDEWRFEVLDDPGQERLDLTLRYGELLQHFRYMPMGDYGNRSLGVGKTFDSLRLEYAIESAPAPTGEPADFHERRFGRQSVVRYWDNIKDVNDLTRRSRQYAAEIGAIGKKLGAGLRVGTIGIKDGWDLCDSIPVEIERGPVDTSLLSDPFWTIWGWAYLLADDGHEELVLTLSPRLPTIAADPSVADSRTVPTAPPFAVHDGPPDTTVSPGGNGTWIDALTGHIWLVDPATGLWYDSTLAAEMGALAMHLAVQEEGVALASFADTLNFVGASVTASGTGGTKTITVAPVITGSINFIIDGGGAAITTGVKGDIFPDFDCTVTSWTIVADQVGSIVVDLWQDVYANFPPTVADTMTTGEKPTLASALANQDLSLNTGAGWAIAAGNAIRFNVDSATTVTRVTVVLNITRTI